MQETPGVLRNETSAILKLMHARWLVDPNKPSGVGWLEYADSKDYFGFLPDTPATSFEPSVEEKMRYRRYHEYAG